MVHIVTLAGKILPLLPATPQVNIITALASGAIVGVAVTGDGVNSLVTRFSWGLAKEMCQGG